jgi:hypothetical protein
LVEGVGGAGEDLARVAMAIVNELALKFTKHGSYRDDMKGKVFAFEEGRYIPQNMSLLLLSQLGSPLRLTAMAFSVVRRHDW